MNKCFKVKQKISIHPSIFLLCCGGMPEEMLAPQDTHTHARTQRVDCCGADARLSLSHVSLPYGRPLLLTFEMFFSLLRPLFLFLSISHSFNTRTHTCLCARTHTHTHTHTHLSATQYFVIKRHCIWSVIKQMWLCKQRCFFKQHIGLSTTSPHALHCSSINACMKTYLRVQMHRHTNLLKRSITLVAAQQCLVCFH